MKQKLLLLFLPLLFTCGLRAQTHFPLYNPNYHYTNDTDATERLLVSWNIALNQAKKQVNASDKDFNAFIQYNQSYIDSERSAISPKIKAGTFTSATVQNYINTQTQKLVALYNNFSNKYKNIQFPKLAPSYTVPTCDSACTNMDFATGDFTGWYGYYEVNSSATNFNLTSQTGGYLGPVSKACYDPNTSSYQMHITSFGHFDYFLRTYPKILMSQVSPWGNGYSVMLGDSLGIDYGVARLEQEFEVTPTTNSITYAYSIFIENPIGHSYYEQPFFSVTILDSSGDTIQNCGKYFVSAGPGLPGFKGEYYAGGGDTVYWRNWTQVNVSLKKYVGQCVTIEFLVADCALGGHFGYAYVDANCQPEAIVPATPGGFICRNGGTLTLDGPFGASDYRWSGPKGGIVGIDTDYNVVVDTIGTYTLVMTPAQGELCQDTLTYTVKNYDSLKATAAVDTRIACYGGVGTALAKEANGYSPFTYLWTAPGGSNAIGTGLSAGTYYVVISDTNACSATATVVLSQPTQLNATIKTTPVICGNNSRTATVTASGGTSPYTYLWAPGGKTTASVTGSAIYTVTVTDSAGCTVTAVANIVQPKPLAISMSNNNITCNGGTGNATASVSGGTSPFNYSWNPSGQTTATATGLGAGSYTVTVKDSDGCTASATVAITQPTAIKATITITYPACNGNNGNATAAVTGGTPAYKYLWTPAGQTNAAATGLSANSYTLTVTDSRGCTESTGVTITQPAVLTVTTSFTHASCNLANGTATASPTGGTLPYVYSWTPGGQTSATAVNLLAGTYTVKVTDNHSCTASATVTVTQPTLVQASITGTTNVTCNGFNNGNATAAGSGGTAPYAYQWSPAGGNGITGTGLTAGKYTVTIKDANGCTATATTVITQPAAMVITISGAPIRCLGSSGNYTASVTGGTPPYIYSWSGPSGIGSPNSSVTMLTPPSSCTYTLTVTDANGCPQYQYVSFSFPPPLAVSISGASVTCSKHTATLCAQPTGGTGGDIFLWEPINLASPCATIPASVTTVYTITITDNCGVSVSASATVDVQPPPQASFVSSTTLGCAPLCIQFHNTTPYTGGVEKYEWSFGDGDSLQEENPIYCYSRAGNYNVTLTVVSDSGCSSSLRKVDYVTVYGKPQAAFTYSPQPVTILSPTVQFTDESTGNDIIYRWWGFGDGTDSTSHSADPVHTYQDTGTYCATLIAMNSEGCTDTITNCLVIEPQYSLYIPSAFTPNGDGLNDVFKPVGEYISDFDMYIFDRWGMEIYHTTDINSGWNGAVHGVGTICQEDTYIYKITVTDAEHNQHSYIGNVTLIK